MADITGHKVEGRQDKLDLYGIKGSRDVILDGTLADVKSASSSSFKKFKEGLTPDKDAFGYLGQLGGYHKAGQNDELMIDKEKAAFVVVDKQHGHLTLDVHEFKHDELDWEKAVQERKDAVNNPDVIPERKFEPVLDGYTKEGEFKPNGSKKLGVNCSYCVSPETLILTKDLKWVKASTLQQGDSIIGFDEESKQSSHPRQYRHGEIIANYQIVRPVYKITTKDSSIIVSEDHQFYSKTPQGSLNKFRSIKELDVGYAIGWFGQPWLENYEKSYLSGFFDGEGCFSGYSASWSQLDGPVIDYVNSEIDKLNIPYKSRMNNPKKNLCKTYRVFGNSYSSFKLMGIIRPIRLLPKAIKAIDGLHLNSKRSGYSKIISIEYLGEQEVCAIETTTKTYISNGFLSHNCAHKFSCYPDLRVFISSTGPRFYTEVAHKPKMLELTKEEYLKEDVDNES